MEAVFNLIGSGLALVGAINYLRQLQQIVAIAPRVTVPSQQPELSQVSTAGGPMPPTSEASVAVIIPAYNEAINIRDCMIAALAACDWPANRYQVWVIDDQSTDNTLAIAQALEVELSDPRLHLLSGGPPPSGVVWVGKNWACAQGAAQAQGSYLLFLDADMRLKPGSIKAALQTTEQACIDLLSCCPANECGSLAEWLVQPLVFAILAVGFRFDQVNDPTNELAFATGQFMLFRRSAYDQIGGHQSVASQPVEDVALARRIQRSGLNLTYTLGHDLASVRMYSSWTALWEGWTKNWYLGSNRNGSAMLQLVGLVLLVCTLPWIELVQEVVKACFMPLHTLEWFNFGIAAVTVALHYRLRQLAQQISALSTRYWWLTGLGGLLIAAIAIASVIKTETGWGWTWRGRSLQLPVIDDSVND